MEESENVEICYPEASAEAECKLIICLSVITPVTVCKQTDLRNPMHQFCQHTLPLLINTQVLFLNPILRTLGSSFLTSYEF